MYILGINCYLHDASVSLFKDGNLVYAIEEERMNREKHSGKFPVKAIQYCLDQEGISLNDIEHIGFYWKPWKGLIKSGLYVSKFALKSFSRFVIKARRAKGLSKGFASMGLVNSDIQKHFSTSFNGNHINFIDHHLAHAASAYYPSSFEDAAILVIDRRGEWDTATLAVGEGNLIKRIKSVSLPSSLGQVYTYFTMFLGFQRGGDEGKVMGLAPYGEPLYYDFLREHIRLNEKDLFVVNTDILDFHLAMEGIFTKSVVDMMGPPRKPGEELTERDANIAASVQKILEDTVLHLVERIHKLTKKRNLCMAGGVALNCTMNGKILEYGRFENLFIQPAAYDAGTSLGAALMLYHGKLKRERKFEMRHAYWGPEYNNKEIKLSLDKFNLAYTSFENNRNEFYKYVAKCLADRKIVGWFQGRMEFGPRALGSRSILADPRDPNMKDTLNTRVKHREGFRPYAPSVMEEHTGSFFSCSLSSPYMLMAYDVLPDKRSFVPSITHVDGTARVQTVSKETNSKYWKLIDEFNRLTGVPLVLNTSFNDNNEPIVCSPDDAIRCFQKTEMDCLAIGDFLVGKNGFEC